MKLLLDTCTFLWIASGAPELSPTAKKLFQQTENEVYLSAASAWEISIKFSLRKLPLPESPEIYIPDVRERHEIEPLPIAENATLHIARLPHLHADPFDRLLVAQALTLQMAILTPDPLIVQYGVQTFW